MQDIYIYKAACPDVCMYVTNFSLTEGQKEGYRNKVMEVDIEYKPNYEALVNIGVHKIFGVNNFGGSLIFEGH